MTSPAAITPTDRPSTSRPRGLLLTAITLTFLKPSFKKVLGPAVVHLNRAGATANQGTLTSLCSHSDDSLLFAMSR
jgi:hypothetical protein